MIPPVPASTLNANPQFAELYKHITTQLLNPLDGSTRSSSSSTAGANALDQELRTHRAHTTKTSTLLSTLHLLPLRSLPEPLSTDLSLLLSPPPNTPPLLLTSASESVASSLPLIADAVSSTLTKSTLDLARLVLPGTPTRDLARKFDSLPAIVALRVSHLAEARANLLQQQFAYTQSCLEALALYSHITSRLTALHRQKTTVVSKAASAKTSNNALVALNIASKLTVLRDTVLFKIYDPETVMAMEVYGEHLRDVEARLRGRKRTVEGELGRYAKGGGEMRGLVERWERAEGRRREVERAVGRLLRG